MTENNNLLIISYEKEVQAMCKKDLFVLGAVIVTAVIVVMFFPVIVTAAGEVVIPPSWSQKLDASKRFVLVLDNAAVLDKETGLVWEQSPATTPDLWYNAIFKCANALVGGRKGWHLPTVEQLASLVDTSVSGYPKLPAGHPFTGVPSTFVESGYWSATTAYDTTYAWFVFFGSGGVGPGLKIDNNLVWCVRGGQSNDGR